MAKSQQTFNKKEKEKKRLKKRQEKLERRAQRKLEKAERGTVKFEDMLAYVDENGNLTDTPPDPSKKKKIKAEDILLGARPIDRSDEIGERRGKINFFNEEKGYGFITDSKSGQSIFVHVNNLEEPVKQGYKVTYEIEMGPKGPSAIDVKIA
ncbi:MAG: cold shock domain-containing protein [Bacteroidota bacterium]